MDKNLTSVTIFRYHPRSNEFSELLAKTGMYRNYSLNTVMDKSPVWIINVKNSHALKTIHKGFYYLWVFGCFSFFKNSLINLKKTGRRNFSYVIDLKPHKYLLNEFKIKKIYIRIFNPYLTKSKALQYRKRL